MRKVIKGYMAGILTMMLLSGTVLMASPAMREIVFGVNVSVDGNVVQFEEDMRPFIMEGRTFLPVRAIADIAGFDVDFDSATNTVTLSTVATPEPEPIPEPLPELEPVAVTGLHWDGYILRWDNVPAADYFRQHIVGYPLAPPLVWSSEGPELDVRDWLYFKGHRAGTTIRIEVNALLFDGITYVAEPGFIDWPTPHNSPHFHVLIQPQD